MGQREIRPFSLLHTKQQSSAPCCNPRNVSIASDVIVAYSSTTRDTIVSPHRIQLQGGAEHRGHMAAKRKKKDKQETRQKMKLTP
jgi:hypothetical protein